jgi:hypothetical protein
MKKEESLCKYFMIVFVLFLFSPAYAQEQENLITKTKTIEKVFDNSNISGLFVINSFGNINISTWKSNRLEMTIEVEVSGWEEEDVDLFLEKLLPEPYSSGDVEGVTVMSVYNFKLNKNCYCPDEKKVYRPWFGKKAEVKSYRINYDIKIPETVDFVNLGNTYGNVSIPSFKGKLIVDVRNGDLKTGNLDLVSCECPGIKVRYGRVNLGEVNNGILNFYSCELVKISALNDSKLTSSFSNVQLGRASGVSLQSKSDDYLIDHLDSLSGKGQFTTLSIEKLGQYLNFNNRSGEIIVSKINPDFKSIVLDGQYNHYSLDLSGLEYLFSAKLESTELNCTESICSKSFKNEAMSSSITFNKKIGSGESLSRISLNCSKCNIDLKTD